jgi:hypothetical protein
MIASPSVSVLRLVACASHRSGDVTPVPTVEYLFQLADGYASGRPRLAYETSISDLHITKFLFYTPP